MKIIFIFILIGLLSGCSAVQIQMVQNRAAVLPLNDPCRALVYSRDPVWASNHKGVLWTQCSHRYGVYRGI